MRKIIVIGGGFAGLTLVKKLAAKNDKNLEILLIDRSSHHTFQPLLYQVATGALPATSIASPFREILKGKAVKIIMENVTFIDRKKRTISLGSGENLPFDDLIIATGARHHYFGHPEWEKAAPGLKSTLDALSIREKILLSFEEAEKKLLLGASEKEVAPYLTFVVIGAGPTGVELAGTLAEIANKSSFRKNFSGINFSKIRVILIEAMDRVLPPFPADLSEKAKKQLISLGAEVLLNTKVDSLSSDGVSISSGDKQESIASKNILWAAGNLASPLLASLDTPLDRAGRAIVLPDLSIPGDPQIFCMGDCAFVPKVPGVAPAAMQMGRYVASALFIPEQKRKPFVYLDKGSLATIGKWRAVGYSWKIHLSGFLAWNAWAFIHLYYLIGFKNRARVFLDWIGTLITGVRTSMMIYRQKK